MKKKRHLKTHHCIYTVLGGYLINAIRVLICHFLACSSLYLCFMWMINNQLLMALNLHSHDLKIYMFGYTKVQSDHPKGSLKNKIYKTDSSGG